MDRASQMITLVTKAQAADQYRKRLRKAHPRYGTGTLSAACGVVQEPPRCDTAYLEALQIVVAELLARSRP